MLRFIQVACKHYSHNWQCSPGCMLMFIHLSCNLQTAVRVCLWKWRWQYNSINGHNRKFRASSDTIIQKTQMQGKTMMSISSRLTSSFAYFFLHLSYTNMHQWYITSWTICDKEKSVTKTIDRRHATRQIECTPM
jgi:hypothetical protein